MKIYVEQSADRDAMVTILARNGYTVRQGKEKQGSKYLRFVEYWKGDSNDRDAGTDRSD